MRRQFTSKSDICPESMDVNAACIVGIPLIRVLFHQGCSDAGNRMSILGNTIACWMYLRGINYGRYTTRRLRPAVIPFCGTRLTM